MNRQTMRVAAHEAGHALAGAHMGFPVHFSEVDADGAGGRTIFDPAAVRSADPRAALYACLAGREAEHMLVGPHPLGSGPTHRTDYQSAHHIARLAADAGLGRSPEHVMGEVGRDARDFVLRAAPIISAMAAELVQRGRLEADDVAYFARALDHYVEEVAADQRRGDPVDSAGYFQTVVTPPQAPFPDMTPGYSGPDGRVQQYGYTALPDADESDGWGDPTDYRQPHFPRQRRHGFYGFTAPTDDARPTGYGPPPAWSRSDIQDAHGRPIALPVRG